jgi:hypothetical protein
MPFGSGQGKVSLPSASSGLVNRLAAEEPAFYLTPNLIWVNCLFAMATLVPFMTAEVTTDLEFPQREAAFFYGLFLRGHSAEKLRQDIEVPQVVLAKWSREVEREPQLRDVFARMLDYRRHVLAIFDSLIGSEETNRRVQ